MDRCLTFSVLTALVAAVAVIGMVSETATAIDTTWNVPSGDWSTGANWDNGEPVSGDNALIYNGGTASINQSGEISYNLQVRDSHVVMNPGGGWTIEYKAVFGFEAPGGGGTYTGTLTINGGTITGATNAQLQAGRYGGTGYIYQYGGTVNMAGGTGGSLFVSAYGHGEYELHDGTLNMSQSSVGYGGDWTPYDGVGIFTQTGGAHNTDYLAVAHGWTDGSTGTYNMQDGTLTVNGWLDIGWLDTTRAGSRALTGTFNQSGGSVTVQDAIAIGYNTNNANSTGTYNFTGGTLTDAANDAGLYVRYDGGDGTFQGHGTVDLSGTLQNNGRVIADGGTLDMSSFGSVTSNIENTTTNGWFAVNGGTLELPSISVTVDGSYNWGEDASDTQIDLVNSVRTTFNGVSGSGDLDIDLVTPAALLIGAWDVSNTGFTFSTADLTFRYDDALAVDESQLLLYHDSGAGWTDVPFTLDMANNLISATGLTSFSKFAIGVIPEPSSVVLAIFGLLALSLHGRRKRRV